jgi:hypothetical protein
MAPRFRLRRVAMPRVREETELPGAPGAGYTAWESLCRMLSLAAAQQLRRAPMDAGAA